MEKFEPKLQNNQESELKIQEDFKHLQCIIELLRGMGLRVIDKSITMERFQDPTSEIGFPIVKDRANGIRASYSKREGLQIWFTNGFEDPKDPKRQEIERQMKDAGLI